MTTPRTALFACAALIAATAGAVQAQTYPSKPIRMIVGFPPGGSNDIVARQMAPKLTQLLGAQVIVENRPGANATIATDFVAKAPPDGYTLMLGSASPLVISPFTYPNIPYDTLRDLTPITTVGSTPEMVAIHPSLPARNLKELVALAKSQPGKLNFASSGNGGLPHLAIELFGNLAKVKIVHVPYKGAGPAAVDLMGGHVHAMIIDMPALAPGVKSGKLRGIAVTAEKRSSAASGPSDDSRAGHAGSHRGELVRDHGARQDSEADRRQAVRRPRQGCDRAGHETAVRHRRRRSARAVLARGVRGFPQERSRAVGQGREGIRRESGLIVAQTFPRLQRPGRIGPMRLRNRVVMAPMGTNYSTTDGLSTERDKMYYAERARAASR